MAVARHIVRADLRVAKIQAEDHERKPGFERRIDQLRKEKGKAEQLTNILAGKPVGSGVQISVSVEDSEDENELLRQAIALSLQEIEDVGDVAKWET